MTLESVMAELKKKGSDKTRAIHARHGNDGERAFGVSVADLKLIAKTIRGQQALAMELYATGILDAMYLAGMVAHGSKMTAKELQAWGNGAAGMQMISEYTVPWVTVENASGRKLALEWMASKVEHIAASGWCTYGGLVATMEDDALDLKEIQGLLKTVAAKMNASPNRVRATMNMFVVMVGSYVTPLLAEALAAADEIGKVSVDVGDTDCKTPLAVEYIQKARASKRGGMKRKTMRC